MGRFSKSSARAASPPWRQKDRKRKIVTEMAVNPIMERAELVVRGLQGQSGAELRLSPGTFEEDDHVAGHGKRHGAAEVLFHKRECEIDPRGHASRGPYATVA